MKHYYTCLFFACSVLFTGCAFFGDEKPSSPVPLQQVEEEMMEEESSSAFSSSSLPTQEVQSSSEHETQSSSEQKTEEPVVRTVQMSVEKWKFTPNTVMAKKGEKLIIEMEGINGTHSLLIPSLGIDEEINADQTKTVEIPTDQVGSFPFLCGIPCGAGHSDMRGTIEIVE